MNKKDLSKLIEKYLNNESLPQDKVILEKYLESFQEKDNAWVENEMGDKHLVEEKIFAAIMKNINKEKINSFQRLYNSPYFSKIAAAIVLFIFLASGVFFISGVFKQRANEPVWIEKVTEFGEKSLLTFSDGTKVTLNSGSKLKYPNRFDHGSRNVFLEGEAYFDVTPDSNNPFIVKTNALTVVVLGTSFNVSAYPEEKEVAVSLIKGRVKIDRKTSSDKLDVTLLQPEQQLVYSREKDVSIVQQFDLLEIISWKDNILKVSDEPLDKVFIKLERFFGIKFELANKSYAKIKITANFKNDSFKTGIEILEKLTGLKHKIIFENNKIIKIVFN